MTVEEIKLNKVIMHILDTKAPHAVLSDTVLTCNYDFGEVIKGHICKIHESDEAKKGEFTEESEIEGLINSYTEEQFIVISKAIAIKLFTIMQHNIDIPAADLIITEFSYDEMDYIAILKLNHRVFLTHFCEKEEGYTNKIIKNSSALPPASAKLTEATVICLEDNDIELFEKKYDVNGIKTNYFSTMFLECRCHLSTKAKLKIVLGALDTIIFKYYGDSESYIAHMQLKKLINTQLEEKGYLSIQVLATELFEERMELLAEFEEKMDKYNFQKDKIEIKNGNTSKKFLTQSLSTERGTNIILPMQLYQNGDYMEIIENEDGSKNILLKSIMTLTSN